MLFHGRKSLVAVLSFLIFSASLVSSAAHAAILFEPYGKYSMGTLQSTTAGVSSSANTSGYGAGARLGFQGSHLFLAADYSALLGGKVSADTGSSVNADNLKETQFGAVVGLRFSFLRVWGGYDFTNELSADVGGVTTMYHGGNAIKAGLGFDLHPVSLNVEYVTNTYKQEKTNGVDTNDEANDVKGHAIVLSLSFPLTF